ncbi:peptidase M14 [Bowmanella sp. Y26]|uniref:M14 family zinc carboxypeptidase n=1 Tax=Bowmanella yangjiangensis TaxID=2811230 RepID=UPI001BDD27F9|nr:M14 family zinc carboxypeptidase [Bowmanella yangjiangensis]MBT1063643.1 peptidase M14 [Bowmanella yangjiangensis]
MLMRTLPHALKVGLMVAGSVFCLSVQADVRDTQAFYPQDVGFNPDIPTPEAFLGHPLGERMARNDLMVAYLKLLAEKSDRIQYEVIAHSHEKRPIVTLTISSPENLARLEQIRSAHLALQKAGGKQAISQDMPVVSWVNYGVHGGEVSSTDSAMPVAYHLAAANGAQIERILKDSVILLTASFNPDGNSRESAWNWTFGAEVPVTDGVNALHGEPWPSGRTNHYWFDLNRQWMLQQHPEPVGWVAKFHQWRPNMVADFHEMHSHKSYYFHPGAPDRVFPLIGQDAMALLSDVVQGPRDFMDSEARLYFNEESYDNFYIGKGATYPHLYGSLGILFEQSSTSGLLDTPRGLLSFRDNIRTQYRVGISLLDSAAAKRESLLSFQRKFADATKALAQDDKTKAYVFSVPGDEARAFHFLELLHRNQIEVKRLARDVKVDGQVFSASNAFVVETDQPTYRMIKGMFERITSFENNTFYDVSGWTMPLAFGVEYAALSSRSYKAGDSVLPAFPSQNAPAKADVAYAFDWSHYYAPRALYRLLKAGYRPRVTTEPFTTDSDKGKVTLGRGSIVMSVGWQGGAKPDELHSLMSQIAKEDAVPVYAVGTSYTASVGMDLGSNLMLELDQPKVLLVIGEGISQYDAGEVWHLLDKRMQMPVVLLHKDKLSWVNLKDYSHLIMVGGSYADLADKTVQKIDGWVKDGGTVVGIRDGAKWAGQKLLDLNPIKFSKGTLASAPRIDYANKENAEAQDIIGGAIMAGDLDITHPLGFGYQSRDIASQRNTLLAFEPPKNPFATVVKIADKPLLSGFASPENQQQLAGKAMLVAERKGKGSVILFTDNPNFRAYFYGTEKLFMNSLFFSKAFNKPRA